MTVILETKLVARGPRAVVLEGWQVQALSSAARVAPSSPHLGDNP
jgi:hypothetical protein